MVDEETEQLQRGGIHPVEVFHDKAHGLPLRVFSSQASKASSVFCFCLCGVRVSGG